MDKIYQRMGVYRDSEGICFYVDDFGTVESFRSDKLGMALPAFLIELYFPELKLYGYELYDGYQ
jgi:hypothetical protein